MRERSIKKLERDLRGELLQAASRLLATAEKLAADGRPQLLRTIVAISRSAGTAEAAKMRQELTAQALERKAEEPEGEATITRDLADYASELKGPEENP